jgi:UDP-N-acetylmuramyl pentapeptide phosphotransferase/UDP-N-acetylglucosamine-1-phosphate transferase
MSAAIPAGLLPNFTTFAPVFLGIILMTSLGFADDLRHLGPRLKMLLLVVAAAPVLLVGTLEQTSLPWVGEIALGVLAMPLTLFWVAGLTNAFNFMDGIDGIAGLTAVVTGALYWQVGVSTGDADLTLFAGLMTGAALGFLPWNFPRARIFMGDTGSLPLGMLLATLGLLAARPAPGGEAPQLAFPAAVLALGPFVFDTAFTLVRRALRGERLGEAHREHLYQRLSRLWGGHARVSLLYAGMSVGTAVLASRYAAFGPMGKALSLILPLTAMLAFAGIVLRADRQHDSTPST